jgi:hypothetical protein
MNAPAPVSARLHDVAVLLPCVGLLLLMPPFIGLFSPRLTLLGIPLLVFYVFGVWAVLIVLTAVLARRLDPPEPARDADPPDLPPA